MIVDDKVGKSNKGNTIETGHQVVPDMENFGLITAATKSSNGCPLEVSDNNLSQSGVENFGTASVILGEEVSKSNKEKQIEAPHQVV
ncbi:hypothetical protein A2U01_0029170, partial [Trifolium medium]|nr:hypothetical protein [Trifolium medium]